MDYSCSRFIDNSAYFLTFASHVPAASEDRSPSLNTPVLSRAAQSPQPFAAFHPPAPGNNRLSLQHLLASAGSSPAAALDRFAGRRPDDPA
jgi:hypothetical protein